MAKITKTLQPHQIAIRNQKSAPIKTCILVREKLSSLIHYISIEYKWDYSQGLFLPDVHQPQAFEN